MGQSLRPKGSRAEVGFLGRGSQPPPHQLEGLGEHCKLSRRVQGGVPAAKMFSCILEAPHGLSWKLVGAKFAGAWPPWPP